MLAQDSFGTGVNWLLERTVDTGMNGVSFGPLLVLHLDFADDVAILAELLELLVPALEMMTSEAASLGLELNWQKTSSTITVLGQLVEVVEEFVYLVHSTTQCITLPVESAPFFIPSTSFCSLSTWFISFCAYHLITVTTFAVTIYHSLGFSLQT